MDLKEAYAAALADWDEIMRVHEAMMRILESNPSFDCMPPPTGPSLLCDKTPFGPPLRYQSLEVATCWMHMYISHLQLVRAHPAMPPAAMVAAGVSAAATAHLAATLGRISAGVPIPATDAEPLVPALAAALIQASTGLFFAGIQFAVSDQRAWMVDRLVAVHRRTGWASAGAIAQSCELAWQKAGEIGRGPPYQRRTRMPGEKGPILLLPDDLAGSSGTRTGSVSIGDSSGGHAPGTTSITENRFVFKFEDATWSKGLLSEESDWFGDEEIERGRGE